MYCTNRVAGTANCKGWSVLALIILAGASSAQITIYVDQATGDDMDDGLTPMTAVAHVSRGCQLVGSNGTVEIGPGLYTRSAGEVFPASANGAITVRGSGSALTILDGEMVSGTVLQLNGSAIRIEGLTVQHGNAAVGAGIYIGEPATLDLLDVHIIENAASIGGGLHVQQNTFGTAATLIDCVLVGNTAAIGAGIQYQINTDAEASLTCINCVFTGNVASIGGAIQFQENGLGTHTLITDRCTFRSNTGAGAGGIHFQRNAGMAIGRITSSFFTANDSALVAGDAAIDVVNCTFTGNGTAFSSNNGVASVRNSIFWGNGTELAGGVGGSVAYSIVEGLTLGGYADLGNNLGTDPLVDMNGHIPAGSAAIDQGNDSAATALSLTLDIDGDVRIYDDPTIANGPGGAIDIGADEAAPPPPPPPACDLQPLVTPATRDIDLGLDVLSTGASSSVTALFEFSTDSGLTWMAATAAASSSLPSPAAGVPAGLAVFTWNSFDDMVGRASVAVGVLVRATIDDGVAMAPAVCVSAPFDVDNVMLCTGICGDCNLDTLGPTIVDALTAAQIAVAIVVPTPPQAACCDVDSDTDVDVLDALLIAQGAAGLAVTLTCL